MRSRPQIGLTPCPPEYARLVASGWDSAQEAYPFAPSSELVERLTKGKAEAQEASSAGRDGVATIEIGGEPWTVHSSGARGGVAFRLENDDLEFLIRGQACDWGVNVRYLSGGLWGEGWPVLRERAREFISAWCERKGDPGEQPRVTRADWCFDFYSPAFSREFRIETIDPLVVCHSSSKKAFIAQWIGTSRKLQTLTIGSKAGYQATVYDKTDEITEASGKTWFYELWADKADGEILERDVWRLELRMGGEYIRARNCQRLDDFDAWWRDLVIEALYKIRLAAPDGEARAHNRPLHPLWSEAVRYVDLGGDAMLPIGRRIIGRRTALLQQQLAQIAGAARSAAILAAGEAEEANLQLILTNALEVAKHDPKAAEKADQARARYEFIDEAR